jgi:transcriptional regulator with XRE-family HTH domain
MKDNFFKKELKRRGEVDKTTYAMVGAEIKRLRLKNNKTLSSIAENLCSVSYVCKIERAQIKPNRHMLGEIFKKLYANDSDVKSLFDLKDFIFDSVKWFYHNNDKKFEETLKKIRGLDNYRTSLFKFIYYIYVKDLKKAQELLDDIFKIANILTNMELYVFLFFSSVLNYYEEDYELVIDNLKLIARLDEANLLSTMAYYYIFKAYFKMNNPMCIPYGDNLANFYFKTFEFERGEEIKYLMCVYKVWNGMGELMYKELNQLRNKSYKTTLDFYFKVQNSKFNIRKFKEKTSLLTPFARLLFLYLDKNESFEEELFKFDQTNNFELEYSFNILNYLTIKNDDDKVDELLKCYLPNVEYTKNALEKKFFIDQLCEISLRSGRYKLFCSVYKELKDVI